MPQASRLSIRNDGQDARPTGTPRSFGDCHASLAMTAPDPSTKTSKWLALAPARTQGNGGRIFPLLF